MPRNLLQALVDDPDIEYVLGVQEASVVAMTEGYARATGRTAVASLHTASGTANGLVGLINAVRSRPGASWPASKNAGT